MVGILAIWISELILHSHLFFLFFFCPSCHFLGIASHNLSVIKCDCLGNIHGIGIHLHAAAISAQGILSFFLVLPSRPAQPPLHSADEMWQHKTQAHFLEIYQHPEGKLRGKGTIEKGTCGGKKVPEPVICKCHFHSQGALETVKQTCF